MSIVQMFFVSNSPFLFERKRKAEEEHEEQERKKLEAEWNKNFEVSL